MSHVRPSYHIRTSARGRADVLTVGRGLDRMTGGQLRTLTRETGRTAADRRGTRWGRDGGEASPRADLAGGWGATPLDEADRTTTSADRRANSPLYGRDRGGMLDNYAADYAARELFTGANPTLYRIVCRWIAGY